jgi:hypothetical protein
VIAGAAYVWALVCFWPATRKERRSFRFHTYLAGILLDEGVYDALLELAEEEARHLVQFEMEYNKLVAGERRWGEGHWPPRRGARMEVAGPGKEQVIPGVRPRCHARSLSPVL